MRFAFPPYGHFKLDAGGGFAAICHFVQFSGMKSVRAFKLGAERFFKYGQFT
jgi:hypothetical protein